MSDILSVIPHRYNCVKLLLKIQELKSQVTNGVKRNITRKY